MSNNTEVLKTTMFQLALGGITDVAPDAEQAEVILDMLLTDVPHELLAGVAVNLSTNYQRAVLEQITTTNANEAFSMSTLEDIAETIREHKLEALGYFAKKIAIKAIRLSVKALLFTTSLGADVSRRTDLITSYWDKSIKLYIGRVEHDFFNEKEFTLLPMEYISNLSEIVLNTFIQMQGVKDFVYDSSPAAITNKLANIAKAYKKYGVLVDFGKNKFDDDIRERRKHTTLAENGWSKSNFPALAARMAKIGKALHKQGDHAAAIAGFDLCAKTIVEELAALNSKLESGKITKDSSEYKNGLSRIMTHSFRLTACSLLVKVATQVAEHLVKDTVYVFRAMEAEILDIKEKED